MPPADEKFKLTNNIVKAMLYGIAKMRKTTWIAKASELGFNVIIIDAEKGADVVKDVITPEGLKRIFIIDCQDTTDRVVAAEFVVLLLKGEPMIWDEQAKRRIFGPEDVIEGHTFWQIDLSKLTHNDIVGFDSYTKIVKSTNWRFAKEQNLDLSDAEKIEWPGYRYTGMLLDWVLDRISSLTCSTVVVGHGYTYEKFKGEGKQRKLISSRYQMRSSSGPHGETIAKEFDDILYFYMIGSQIKIDSGPTADRDGGCRNMPPKVWNWEELQFKHIANSVNLKPTGEPCQAFTWHKDASTLDFSIIKGPVVASKQTIDATKPKGNSLANLLAKQS